jgi:hypothetical protein
MRTRTLLSSVCMDWPCCSGPFAPLQVLQKNAKLAKGQTSMHIFPGVGHFELEGEHYDERVVDVLLTWIWQHIALPSA